MTKLHFFNFYIAQWFGFRLSSANNRKKEWKPEKGGWVETDELEFSHWLLLIGVVPLTGWWSEYIGPVWQVRVEGIPEKKHWGELVADHIFYWAGIFFLIFLFCLLTAISAAIWAGFWQMVVH